MNSKKFFAYAHTFSPSGWLEKLIQSVNENVIDGVVFPSFPEKSLQESFVGSSNAEALVDASLFYNIITSNLERLNCPLTPDSRVMDFGCGWGRIGRLFYRDLRQENLYLVDSWQMVIDKCKETGIYGQLLKTEILPPLIFGDNQFDLIYAFSVFSHLSEMASNKWISEFHRVLKPGGHIIVTVQGRSFIDFCKMLRMGNPRNVWEESLANSFTNEAEAYETYDNGGFLYVPSGGGPELPPDIYGDAIVSKGYVEKHWATSLKLIDFVDDRAQLPQAYVILQKPR